MLNTSIYFLVIVIIISIPFLTSLVNYKQPYIEANTSYNSDSNKLDAKFLSNKLEIVYKLKQELNEIKEKFYTNNINDIIKFNAVKKTNKKDLNYSVKLDSPHNFDNLYTIEIPMGEIGQIGSPGEQGQMGIKGDTGTKGPDGHCGILLK